LARAPLGASGERQRDEDAADNQEARRCRGRAWWAIQFQSSGSVWAVWLTETGPEAYAVVLGSESRFAFIRVKPNGCSYPAALWNRASRYNGIPKVSGSVPVSSTDRW